MTQEKINPKKVARIAGLLYIPPWILSLIAIFLRQDLIVAGDAAATAQNIAASHSTFTLSIIMDLIVQVTFVFLVLVLYRLFKHVNKNHAMAMAVLFLVSVPLAMLNTLNLFAAQLLSNNNVQFQGLVPFFLELNEIGIYIAYIFWGLWLFPFGYLAFKSDFIPKILGIYLMISCFGYLIDFATYFFFPDVGIPVNMLTGWAELFICIWLLINGVDVEVWQNRALEEG